LVAGLALIGLFLRTTFVREQSRRRLHAPMPEASAQAMHEIPRPDVPSARSIFRRHRLLPWILAAAVGLGCFYGLGINLLYTVTIAIIVELLSAQAETFLVERKKALIDRQLAESLDLMISTLRAGASVVSAMERAADESKPPLKTELLSTLGLIRYGDDPGSVMRRLMQRVPLESFRLFTITLAVHFEVGGSLAPTLAVVARIIRDRIEVAARVRALTAQARASTITLIIVTYFIAFLMWRNDPAGVRTFVTSGLGSAFIAGSMLLQAVGVVWQASMTKMRS
jgi:tight adherence protein B